MTEEKNPYEGVSSSELIKALRETLPEKITYGQMVGAPEPYCHGGPMVYMNPECYLVEAAADRLELLTGFEPDKRFDVYRDAVQAYGLETQLVVAVEELSEAQKEICKMLRGKGDSDHLAEEVADAIICLEQVMQNYDLYDKVIEQMRLKVDRLADRVKKDVEAAVDPFEDIVW